MSFISEQLVRTVMGQYDQSDLHQASLKGDLDTIFDSLNYLGQCSWRVNGRILDLMIELFNGKGDTNLDIIGPDLPEIEKRKTK